MLRQTNCRPISNSIGLQVICVNQQCRQCVKASTNYVYYWLSKRAYPCNASGSNTQLNVRVFHGLCFALIAGYTGARPRPPAGSRRYFEKGISNRRFYSAGNY